MQSIALLSLLAVTALATDHMTHTVTVGGVTPPADATGSPTPMLIYTPESVKAATGDMIHFIFKSKNHTATQSTFDDPCKKMDGGADSGFMPNPDDNDGLTWDFEVPSEEPIWMYCAQKTGNHCGKGMVFSINAKDETEKSFSAYKQLAMTMYGEVDGDAAMDYAKPYVDGDAAPTKTCAQPVAATPTVVDGQGTDACGNACSCSCLCGAMPMADGMGMGHYGGMGGMMPKKAEDKYEEKKDDKAAEYSSGSDYSY